MVLRREQVVMVVKMRGRFATDKGSVAWVSLSRRLERYGLN
jgi:hypothetical protein